MRIPDLFQRCIVYLYPSHQSANNAEAQGGCGFIVSVPSELAGNQCRYVVTARHVVQQGSCRAICLNSRERLRSIIETDPSDWYYHPDADDIAVCPVEMKLRDHYEIAEIPLNRFLTKEQVYRYDLGPGDDVILAGRFVLHEGQAAIRPSVRFGNVSMMPEEPIVNSAGISQESFLVEMRSVNAYSGSPAFIFQRPLSPSYGNRRYFPEESDRSTRITSVLRHKWWLLGLDWGHLHRREYVRDRSSGDIVEDGMFIRMNSAMTGVVPAWKISELLMGNELAGERRQTEERVEAASDEATRQEDNEYP